jgi:hypothetical protein
LQEIIYPCTAVHHFSVKSKDLLIFTEGGQLNEKFLELLNGKLEEGVRVREFLSEHGKMFEAEDVKMFREWNRRITWCSTAYNLPLAK